MDIGSIHSAASCTDFLKNLISTTSLALMSKATSLVKKVGNSSKLLPTPYTEEFSTLLLVHQSHRFTATVCTIKAQHIHTTGDSRR